MHQSAKFWDRLAERYSKRPITDESTYRKKLEVTQGYFRPDMQILEFGCGTGSTAIHHAPYVGHIQAIDISSKMLEIARRKAAAENVDNITFERSSIDDYGIDGQCFDAVLGLSILHLLDNWDAVIAKVYGMLKPGGVFISSTLCIGDSKMRFVKYVVPLGKFLGLLPTLKIFTAMELEASLSGAGFEIVDNWQPGQGKSLFIVAKRPM